MAVPFSAFGGGIKGSKTAAIGTAYYVKIDPYAVGPAAYQAFTCIYQINYTNGNTANAITVMRPIGRTTAAAAATTASNTITLAADPGPSGNGIAANDQVVVANESGTWDQYTVGAWNGTTKVMTVTGAALANNVSSGARVWFYGIFSDTDPVTGLAFPALPTAVNTTGFAFQGSVAGARGAQVGDPLLLYNPNATGQSVTNYVEYAYTRE